MEQMKTPPQKVDVLAELGVPLNMQGNPDLLNHIPKRMVQKTEAVLNKWTWFYPCVPCRYGHVAARQTSNDRVCSDCLRVQGGKSAIYPKASHQGKFYPEPRRKAPSQQIVQVAAPKPVEADPSDKRFLNQYAKLRDLDAAAAAVGSTAALMAARRSHNATLDAAMTRLEADLAIPKYQPPATEVEWTADKRAALLEKYIDSGNLVDAREAVKCTPSQLWRELDSNQEFAAALDAARPRAIAVVEEVAIRQALAGNDRLLQVILKAERPEKYTETARMTIYNDTTKLTDDQINSRLLALIERTGLIRFVDESEVIEGTAEPILEDTPALPAPEPDSEPVEFNQNEDLA